MTANNSGPVLYDGPVKLDGSLFPAKGHENILLRVNVSSDKTAFDLSVYKRAGFSKEAKELAMWNIDFGDPVRRNKSQIEQAVREEVPALLEETL